MSEYENMQRLNAARSSSSGTPQQSEVKNPAFSKRTLTLWEKISRHWPILVLAAIFDLLAIIPFISPLFNFIFASLLFLYFVPKRKAGEKSELQKIVLPVFIGSMIDFAFSILPVNLGAAIIRIKLSGE